MNKEGKRTPPAKGDLPDARQRKRVLTAFDANMEVLAGAGTGKTSLLIGRCLTALLVEDLPPESLLCLTFTDKAAQEMADRLEAALDELSEDEGPSPEGDAARWLETLELDAEELRPKAEAVKFGGMPEISTFHAFCLNFLRTHGPEHGLDGDLGILEPVLRKLDLRTRWAARLERELGGNGHEGGDSPTQEDWRLALEAFGYPELERLCLCFLEHREWRGIPLDREHGALVERIRECAARFRAVEPKSLEGTAYGRETLIPFLERMEGLRPEGELPDAMLPLLEKLADENPSISKKIRPQKGMEVDWEEMEAEAKRLKKLSLTYLKLASPELLDALERIFRTTCRAVQDEVLAEGGLGFHDLLALTRGLLLEHPSLRALLADRYRQILVDEFQDTDPLQYDILFLMAQEGEMRTTDLPSKVPLRKGRLCIVGDPKQSIYRFRGADMTAFHKASHHLSMHGRTGLDLVTNFRSRPGVLDFVNALFGAEMKQRPGIQPPYEALSPAREPGGPNPPVLLLYGPAGKDTEESRRFEAEALADRILRWKEEEKGRRFSDVAMLFRTFTHVEEYERALRRAGIPTSRSGGKNFFKRQEVEHFLALVGLMVRPWDPAALLACLRGPIGAVPDAELLSFVENGPHRLDLALCLPPDRLERIEFPKLRAALRFLHSLRERILPLPAYEALPVLLHASGTAVLEAASYEGGQRVANLEVLIRDVAETCRREGLDLQEAETLLATQAEGEAQLDEGNIADAENDAVRILTTHKAKGLEFPLVILPDIGTGRRRWSENEPIRLLPGRIEAEEPRLAFTTERVCSPSWPSVEENEELHQRAEDLRLFYVAVTRAREECWLSFPAGGNIPKDSWRARLEALGVPRDTTPGDGEVIGRGTLRACVLETPKTRGKGAARSGASAAEIREAVENFAARSGRIAGAMREALRAPSRAASPLPRADIFPGAERGDARARGLLIHALLETADFGTASPPARDPRLADERAWKEVEPYLEAFWRSGPRARLASGKVLARELPILYEDEEGRPWSGSIDLCLEEGERIVLVDYKTTGRSPKDPDFAGALLEAHGEQCRIYARALEAALPAPREIAVEIWALTASETLVIPVPNPRGA